VLHTIALSYIILLIKVAGIAANVAAARQHI